MGLDLTERCSGTVQGRRQITERGKPRARRRPGMAARREEPSEGPNERGRRRVVRPRGRQGVTHRELGTGRPGGKRVGKRKGEKGGLGGEEVEICSGVQGGGRPPPCTPEQISTEGGV